MVIIQPHGPFGKDELVLYAESKPGEFKITFTGNAAKQIYKLIDDKLKGRLTKDHNRYLLKGVRVEIILHI